MSLRQWVCGKTRADHLWDYIASISILTKVQFLMSCCCSLGHLPSFISHYSFNFLINVKIQNLTLQPTVHVILVYNCSCHFGLSLVWSSDEWSCCEYFHHVSLSTEASHPPSRRSPSFLGTRHHFHGRHFFRGWGWGWFQDESSSWYLLFTLFLLLLHQEEKGATEDEMVGWHHRLNGHEFEQSPGYGEG